MKNLTRRAFLRLSGAITAVLGLGVPIVKAVVAEPAMVGSTGLTVEKLRAAKRAMEEMDASEPPL